MKHEEEKKDKGTQKPAQEGENRGYTAHGHAQAREDYHEYEDGVDDDPNEHESYETEDKEHLHQPSKYDMALAKYETNLNDEETAKFVADLLREKSAAYNNVECKKTLFNCIDLTSLKSTDNDESILRLTEKVNAFEAAYPDLKNVAALCTYPNFSHLVSQSLEVEEVQVAAVAGGFPTAQTFTEVKVAEVALAVHDGADEVDIVIPVGKFLDGNYEEMCDEIQEMKELCGERKLKVILECTLLKTASNIKKAAILAMYSGADFIKTSTGKEGSVASPEAAYVMCQAIREYFGLTGQRVGFKAAGGINTVDDAVAYYTIAKEVLGDEWMNNEYFRIGTSRLANLLLSDILGEETRFF